MIKKEQARKNGFKTLESGKSLQDEKNQKLEQLKQLIPNLVNSDNQVDLNALKDFIDIANTTSNNKGYELTFAGKGIARAKADSETEFELKVEKEQSKHFENTNNIVIRGDNLEVLKILKQNYFEKIKMIYIDPPYNTKSENFIYKDNFKQSEENLIENFGLDEDTTNFLQNVYGTRSHSGWLSFIYPRLKLARDLLKEDGVIFISIDDNEQANLKILCDEIFGEENFVASFIWKTTKSAQGMKTKNLVVNNYETILCYEKNKDHFEFLGLEREKKDFSNPDQDKRGLWKRQYLQRLGQNLSKKKIINPKTNFVYEFETPYSQEKLNQWVREGVILFPDNDKGYPAKKEFLNEYKNNKQLTTCLELYSTKAYTERLYKLFDNKKIFTNPKPDDLIKFLVQQSCHSEDIILDFFAGSGTTGDAVMQLNTEDISAGSMQVEKQRKFILVQYDEEIKENTEPYQFCKENHFEPVISSICIERLNRTGNKIKKELENKKNLFQKDKKLDIGYKVFSLTKKPKINQDKNNLFKLENQRENTIDTLYNMMSATCKPLDTQIEELIKNRLYLVEIEIENRVEKSLYVLNEISKKDLKGFEENQIYIDGYSNINLENWLNLEIRQKENITVVY